jgi:hypothetical protein
LLCAAILAVPGAASGKVTREDRAFAHAYERFDAAVRAASADPASVAAVHARQQGAAGCVDAARALTEADRRDQGSRTFDALFFYSFYAADPLFDAIVRAEDTYERALKRMHLRNRALRSARAVLILVATVRPPSHDVLADFCGPLRAWQAAGFAKASTPAQVKTMSELVDRAPQLTKRRHATLRRALVRLRAAGMPRRARESFVAGGVDLEIDKLLHGDPILAALEGS